MIRGAIATRRCELGRCLLCWVRRCAMLAKPSRRSVRLPLC